MILASILGSISIAFGSSVVGLLVNNAIRKQAFYASLSNLNFVTTEKANRYLGVLYFRHILKTTFWKHFNPTLRITERPDRQKLQLLRNEMTYAEVSHLIAFLFVFVLAVFSKVFHYREEIILPLLIANIAFHIYPALVQQYNKRRLDKVLRKFNA